MGIKSRTWLIAVFHKSDCLAAENAVGSRNYIPRLLKICSLITENATDISEYIVTIVRCDLAKDGETKVPEGFVKKLTGNDIKGLAEAWKHATKI